MRQGSKCHLFLSVKYLVFVWFVGAGYRHVYLEGMEEASVFVHVAVNDVTGKVGGASAHHRGCYWTECDGQMVTTSVCSL